MSDNSVLDRLLDSSFNVDSKSIPNLAIPCRDLPNLTLMRLIGDIVNATNNEYSAHKVEVLDAFASLAAKVGADGNVNGEDVKSSFLIAVPILVKLIVMTPEWIKIVLKDVIVGAEEKHLNALSNIDAISIVDQVLVRIDVDIVSEKLARIFQKAVSVVGQTVSQVKDSKAKEN